MDGSVQPRVFFGDGFNFGGPQDGGFKLALFQVHPQHLLLLDGPTFDANLLFYRQLFRKDAGGRLRLIFTDVFLVELSGGLDRFAGGAVSHRFEIE